jgi:hypothetical protein
MKVVGIARKSAGFLMRLVGGLTVAALIGLLFGVVVQHLWNAILPDLFGFPEVDFWQAVGLVVLSRLLFGGMGPKGRGPFKRHGEFDRHRHQSVRDYYRRRHLPWSYGMHDTLYNSADESDRKAFRDYWSERGQKDFEAYRKERQPE